MWSDLLRVFYTRAAEETDREPPLWPQDVRRAATQQARDQFPKAPLPSFLVERARILSQHQHDGAAPQPPAVPFWLPATGWIAALLFGATLTTLGQESEINLLALPLIGLLIWNAVVLLISLFSPGQMRWLPSLSDALFKRLPTTSDPAAKRFFDLARPAWSTRLAFRFRAWLHIAAALIALGSIGSMYARGWSKEYRAVWESTLLSENSARTFFDTLFKPASTVLQLPVPTADLAQMQRGIAHPAEKPAPALPWIHLYAATLALFILLPRGLFALLELHRSRKTVQTALLSDDWKNYAARLLAMTDGSGLSVQILVHGLALDTAAKDRWRLLLQQQWPDAGLSQFETIAPGSEAAFIETWSPPTNKNLLLIFNLASVPETEIHRWLAQSLLEKWSITKPHPSLLIALDETHLHKRWSGFADYPQRLAQRRDNWVKLFEGLPAQIL